LVKGLYKNLRDREIESIAIKCKIKRKYLNQNKKESERPYNLTAG
jgi:hypothetical protein